jgi:prepilin-type N-terminal cleavage/methylation domain-containing protein
MRKIETKAASREDVALSESPGRQKRRSLESQRFRDQLEVLIGANRVSQGMTLVELLLTIVVLAFGSLAVMTLQTTTFRGNATAENLAVAAILAESEMERLKSLGKTGLDQEATSANPKVESALDRYGQPCPNNRCPGQSYVRTVVYYPQSLTSRSVQVEVEIAWVDHGRRRTLLQSAVITDLSI